MMNFFSDPSPATVHSQYDDFFLPPNTSPELQGFSPVFDHSVPQIEVAKEERKLVLPPPKHATEAGNTPNVSNSVPAKPRARVNGKQMIKMGDGPKKARKPSKLKEEEEFALRKMERFVCVLFCKKCQENTHFDGVQLVILLCERCCERINKFRM